MAPKSKHKSPNQGSSKPEDAAHELEVAGIEEGHSTTQDPFGDERDAHVKYKTMAWW